MNRIIGIGIDIVEIARIERVFGNFPQRFRERVFTEEEIHYSEARRNRFEEYAARFAAKEAAMKALGTGWRRGIAFRNIEVVNEASGKPNLLFSGRASEILNELGGTASFVSLTHSEAYAVAQVILTG